VKKEEQSEEKAFDAYLENRKAVLYEEFVTRRHEEREEKQQATIKSNAEARQHPVVIDSDDDVTTPAFDNSLPEAMEVTVAAVTKDKKTKPTHHALRDNSEIAYKSPLARPDEALPMKQRLQLAEQRLASKNVALKAQELQLETAGRRQVALQQELIAERNKLQIMKVEADTAVAREQRAVSQLQSENRSLLQQVATLNQKAIDYAYLNSAHQLLQAQFDALRAENSKLVARVNRMKKGDSVAPWPAMDDAAAFNVDDLLNETSDLLG
jgi:cell division protein FtsB